LSLTASNPLFSVVIPTYNRAAKVVRAVESVLAQTLANYDVWVIDDGSTDDTADRLSVYMDRIHYVTQVNAGAALARNRGIQESTGKYIALLDSDDRWRPQKLQSISEGIRNDPEAGLFYSQYEVVNEAGRRLWVDRSRAVRGSAYLNMLKGDFLATSSAVIDRKCLEIVGCFDPLLQPCEDWDLWLRISRKYTLRLVPEILVAFEHTPQQKATSNAQGWLAAHDRVIEKAFAADPGLDITVRQALRAQLAYIKGRVCLQSGSEPEALEYFNQALSMQPSLLKARIYALVLSSPRIRRLLPMVLRRRMRLPAEIGKID
jgi:glycosyltransferase involved in cell wall biosynthesis